MTTEKLPSDNANGDYEIDTLTNERLLKDHEYDGIRELDNDPPSWFNLLFIGTIAFAIIYLYILFMFKPAGFVQKKEYEREMARLEAAMAGDDVAASASTAAASGTAAASAFQVMLLTDDQSLASGKQIYNNVCAVCHLADGGGLVGPNLTDPYWVHGNSIEDVFNIVTEGVIAKGMLPYRDQFTARQRLEVSSYILEVLAGSTPANPKAPEGERMD